MNPTTMAISMYFKALLRLTVMLAVALRAAPVEAEPTREEVSTAMHRAVSFFREHASAGGGYIYQLSADLAKREGEGRVGKSTAWIEPPSTPSVGMAYLKAYRQCGDPLLLDAAKDTATALIRGQLRSGGWDNRIEFDPQDRTKFAYRVEPDDGNKRFNVTTFDDDKSQSAIRFLMQLDRELNCSDPVLHECITYALDAVVHSQYDCGAWPQRYSEFPQASDTPTPQASIPSDWPREFPGVKYESFYTLNDNTLSDLIITMLDAWDLYQDERYLNAALRGGDFLLLAQLPEPQPGWAQQYNFHMQPAWARKFEPPAITGGESQGVMRTLITLYRRTARVTENAERFLEPIPPALAYYRRSLLPDGRLARFYELGTNRPLYFTSDYQLVYHADDLPTHYGFIVASKLDQIELEYDKVRSTPREKLWSAPTTQPPRRSSSLDQQAQALIQALDQRGAWVEAGRLKYHGDDDPTKEVIRSSSFSKNLQVLADWLAADAASAP